MLVFGITRLRDMPVDVFPEFAPPTAEIQTEALGLSAAEVETLVTLNTEELLAGVPWLKNMRSRSVPGMSSVQLIFQPGTNLMQARQLVQERLILSYLLPNVSQRPIMLNPVSATSRTMMIGVSSKKLSPIELSVLARWTIKPRLMGVAGVANVSIWGQRERQLQVQIDPDRLRAYGITQEQIIKTTGDSLWVSPLTFLNASFPGTGGWIDTPNQRLGVQHILPISTPEDLARVPVDGAPVRLGDVATVVEGHPLVIGDALHNGQAGLLMVVEKFPGTNTLEVTRGVDAALDALRLGLPNVDVDSRIFRAATFIEMAFDNLTTALLLGGVLVVLALGAFLASWRTALISLVAIPLSLLAAALVLYLRGATLNTMVLAGFVIAVGAIVDDAIIAIDHIVRELRRRRQEGSKESTVTIIREASLEVSRPVLYATLIVVLAVVPVFFMEGVSGAFFRPLAVSYVLAVLASLVTALTVTPALALTLLAKGPVTDSEGPVVSWVQRAYDGLVSRTIHAPRGALVTAVAVVVVGLAVWPLLGQSFLPSFKERHLVIDWVGTPGTSHPAMSRIMNQAARELAAVPGVSNVSAQLGRAVTGDQVVGINASQLWLTIDPKANYEATVAAVQGVVDGYPGLSRSVQTYLRERVREVLTGTDDAIVVRLYGPERPTLHKTAENVKQALSTVNGITDLHVEGQAEEAQVEVRVDLASAERHGLKPGDIRRQVATVFAGIQVGSLFEQQKVFEVVVWGVPEVRNNLTKLRELMLETPKGSPVRLGEVAELRIAPTPTVIHHEALSPRIDVVANVRGRDLGSVTREVQRRLKDVKFPLEYRAELLGEYAERQNAQKRMLSFAIAAAIGIFLLLQASFGSWRLATLVFLTLPAALVGGVLAAFAGGGISLGSLVGFLALLGIAARNGIMLINRYQQLQHEGEPFGPQLVLRGTRERVAPIFMTAATTALALVPLVLLGDIAGLEIVRPMALVILGGLVTSTWLTVLVLPALYLRFGAVGHRVTVLDDVPAAVSPLRA
ncbi:MAG: acriflavin resistance protein [Candidatus Rokubacteria bacterium 13_1_40CM_68_15]|nr:MAG: acriflavin resistance protein [Candidatus Rokubacteria bacterium 13_1_40CM_68_15]